MPLPHTLISSGALGGATYLPDPSGSSTFYSWLPFRIYANSDGTFNTGGFNLKSYSGCGTGGDIYLDVTGGNNANDGSTWALAKKDAWAANAACPANGTIHVAAGTYNMNNDLGGYQGSFGRNRAVIGYGEVIATQSYTPLGFAWALDTNHYEATVSMTVVRVWDATETEVNGEDSLLTLAADEAGCDSTPGSYFYDSGTGVLHIRTHDSREPDGDVHIGRNNYASLYTDTSVTASTYYENIKFKWGATYNMRAYQTNGSVFNIYLKDCEVAQSGNTVGLVVYDGTTLSIMQNCTVRHSSTRGDGIDYGTLGGVQCKGVEIGCTVYNIRGQSTDQCSTAHNETSVVRINGEYYDAEGQIIADVDAGHSAWLLGCYMHDSDAGYGYYGSNAWLDSVRIGAMANNEINVPAGGTVRIRNLTWTGNSGGAGTVVAY